VKVRPHTCGLKKVERSACENLCVAAGRAESEPRDQNHQLHWEIRLKVINVRLTKEIILVKLCV